MSRFVLTAQLQLQAPNNVNQIVQQIQSQLNGVNVNVQVQNSPQAQRQLQQVTQATNQATTAAERMGKAFALSVRRFAAFSIATRAVGLFTSTLGDAVQSAIDFERQLIKVSQVTGKSIGQLRGLTKQITGLATGFGVASSDLLEVSTVLAQAGLTAEDTAVALKTLAKAALAPNFDSITETAEGAIAILAQFGQGVEALESQLGSINAVAGAFAVEASDLIDVIRRTGGVFKASGGNLNELLALFTSVRATTRESAESIGTGLRTIFTRIQRPKTIEFLKQFGVELVDLNGKFVGPYEAIKRLSEALSGLGEGDLTFISIAEELGGFRQIGKVLPLLQQFSTTQSALNVAMRAGDSLTQDAASAQAALAIRIMKVKEEFLALIRSVTETSTFQIMANTALSLASALIKIGDAIKPLLPLLGALAAVKLAKGMAGFFGGIMSGATSGRAYNSGGKVQGFARGGFVPGTGNRDTVPAMLTPGEFVIRKSSVNKIGAGTLAAMNENGYEAGGVVRSDRSLYGSIVPAKLKQLAIDRIGGPKAYRTLSQADKEKLKNDIAKEMAEQSSARPKKTKKQAEKLSKERQAILNKYPGGAFTTRPKSIGGFFLTPESGVDSQYSLSDDKVFELNGQKAAILSGSTIENYLPFRGDIAKNSRINTIVDSNAQAGIKNAVINASNQIGNYVQTPGLSLDKNKIEKAALKSSSDKQVYSTLGGYMYEGIIQGLTGAKLSGGQIDFDFNTITGQNKSSLAALFGRSEADMAGLIKADAKRSQNSKMNTSIFDKIVNSIIKGDLRGVKKLGQLKTQKKFFGGLIQKFANGGEVINRGTINYLKSDIAKAMSSMGLTYNDFFKRIPTPNSSFDQFMVGGIGPESVPFPRFLRPYTAKSQAQTEMEKAQAQKDERISAALGKRGKSMRDYGDYGNRRRRFASGGGVGTDTVPALLTPGEFVINRSSAQRIGYGTLNRMNKVGKYAKGGAVQHFAAGGGVTSKSVKSDIAGLSGNQSIQQDIAATAKEIKKTGEYAKRLSGSLAKQAQVTDVLYKESSSLDARISTYDKALATIAAQQGKAAATGPAANRILKMKMEAESQRIEVDKKAIAEEQKLEGIKKKHAATVEKQTQLMEKQSALIAQAKSNKQAATQLVNQDLTQRNVSGIARAKQEQEEKMQRRQERKQASRNTSSLGGGSMMPKDIGGAAIAVSMVTASLQAMLPPLEENSSTLTKLSHSFLGLVTTVAGVAFALQSFGITLKAQSAMKFLTGGGLSSNGIQSVFNIVKNMGGSTNLAGNVVGVANGMAKLIGPLAAGAATFYAVQTAGNFVVDAFNQVVYGVDSFDTRLKEAIDKGNISKAEEIATSKQTAGRNVNTLSGAAGGAVAGALIAGPIGAAVGAAIGGLTAYVASDLPEYAGAVAAAQAAQVDVQNKLTKATEESGKVLEEYNKGIKSGLDVVKTFASAAAAVNVSRQKNDALNAASIKNDKLSRFTGGYLASSSVEKANAERTKNQNQQDQKILQTAMPGLNAMSRDFALASGSFDDFLDKLSQTPETKAIFDILVRQGTTELRKNFENVAKEVDKAKKAFEALNLGLRAPAATATAASSALSNFTANLEVGSNPVTQSVATLETAFSEAGQAMDPKIVGSAINDIASTLEEFGGSEPAVTKFKENAAAFAAVSANYNEIFKGVKEDFTKADFKNLNAEGFKDKFAANLDEQLKNAGIGDEARKRMGDVVGNIKLDDEDMKKLRGGDLSVFQKYLDEAGNKTLEEAKKIVEETSKINQELIGLTKQRIEAERNLVQAQQEAIDLFMEGREVQGKYGGRAVTTQERRGALLSKSNVEASRLGLSAMRTGDVGELRRRNAEIRGRFSGIESQRTVEGGLKNSAGVEADATQQDLQKAYKTQIETIRGLIKLEEEQLKITEEKNKLEKDSMESLIKGDVEEFFKKQSAVGATAAIATGDERLMRLYGAEALGEAALDLKRQQEAGVQSVYGQRLSGPGGLVEAGAGAALSARGVTDMRAAQMLAGTSPEEEASKSRLRELGGLLGETGMIGADMAEMQVQTATVNINTANLKLEEIKERGRKVAAEAESIEGSPAVAKARGGLIYANRGIFVPRGTDTVPAMLTPGEFVVNRGAVQRGNNLQILQAMNGAGGVSNTGGTALMSTGGTVKYLSHGSQNAEVSNQTGGMFDNLAKFASAISTFNNDLTKNINSLKQLNLSIKLDATSVNVNLNDGGLLKALTEEVKTEVLTVIGNRFKVGGDGRLAQSSTVLNTRPA